MRCRHLPFAQLALLLAWISAAAQTTNSASDVSKWEPDIRAFEDTDRVAPAPREGILFVGSSSIRLWETLQEDFAGLPVVGRGFGGSQIHEVNAFLDRVVLPYRPRLVVFYCGTNDIDAGLAVARVVDDYKAFVRAVHAELPRTRIAFIAAAPNPARWHLRDEMQRLNREVAAYSGSDERLDYLDVWTAMLGPDGQPRPDIFIEDRLHMNARGYAIWKAIVGNYLRRVWNTAASPSPPHPSRRRHPAGSPTARAELANHALDHVTYHGFRGLAKLRLEPSRSAPLR